MVGRDRGAEVEVRADRVVLSAGAYGSPAILLRSGIGPAALLQGLGIPVGADRPVGENLLDHPLVGALLHLRPAAQVSTLMHSRLRWIFLPIHLGTSLGIGEDGSSS